MGSFTRAKELPKETDDETLYRRWLTGTSRERPSYVEDHFIARFLGVRVWDLKRVPIKYRKQAIIILRARFRARLDICEKAEVSPEKIILPEY